MVEFLLMTPADVPEAIRLWSECDGITLRQPEDTPECLARYLERNPGCSFVARSGGELVAAALAGHDARRGFLHHVAVRKDCRHRGIGRELVARCLAALKSNGLTRCHIFVYRDNHEGRKFWDRLGWQTRADLEIMTTPLVPQG